jgi:hypothetical protein
MQMHESEEEKRREETATIIDLGEAVILTISCSSIFSERIAAAERRTWRSVSVA